MNDNKQPDFGPYGPFLEDSVKHILKHKPVSVSMGGITEQGQFIGSYFHAGINDKLLMAGSLLYDAVLDIIRENAKEIKGYLDEVADE